ncbi:MAG: hypothetical protein PHQ23_16500, partial [Candidatus Wallbacteria bacterium]|nr:hypothetical protein [Candidatus Wallbacteria bacterium]
MKHALLAFLIFAFAASAKELTHSQFIHTLGTDHQARIPKSGRAPAGHVTSPAEFDPADGVIICESGQHWDLQKQLIKFIATDTRVFVCGSPYLERDLRGFGVNMANVQVLPLHLTVWVRDFGPWWIIPDAGGREKVLLNAQYGPVQELADKFPGKNPLSGFYENGGNMMFDGQGTAMCSAYYTDPAKIEAIRQVYRE